MATTTLNPKEKETGKAPKIPQIHVSITGEFGNMLQRLSDHLGVSKTAVIRMAVKQMYDQHFPKSTSND